MLHVVLAVIGVSTLPSGTLVVADAKAVAARSAACLDGSPPAFYIWPGVETKKYILFLEGACASSEAQVALFSRILMMFRSAHPPFSTTPTGGGWCFTEKTCKSRSKSGLGSSTGYKPAEGDLGGIMSANVTENPLFANWTKVFVKYCDGSSFSGARIGASNASGVPLHYRGRANLAATLDTLALPDPSRGFGIGNATEVILTGGSAGGLAVFLQVDYVASRLPNVPRIVGQPDAGLFADLPNTAGTYAYRSMFQGADVPSMWNATVGGGTNAACLASTAAEDRWQCLMAQYVVPHLSTPIFVTNAAIDVYQMQNILQVGCVTKQCSSSQFTKIEGYRKEFLAHAVAPVRAANSGANGAWIDSCFMHEQNVYYCSGGQGPGGTALNCMGWLREQVNGISPQQAFLRWYTEDQSKAKGSDHFTVDDEPWPQNPTCSWHFGDAATPLALL